LQLQTTNSFQNETHLLWTVYSELFKQYMPYVCSKDTIPSKHQYIQPLLV